MEEPIRITMLNDFIFYPESIYYHNLYGEKDRTAFQHSNQINGTKAHQTIDRKSYSNRKSVLCGIDVYCEQYGLIGKIDLYDITTGLLTERKKRIKTIYDGYVFQLYGQYFSLKEMGYSVGTLSLYSMDDNKRFVVPRPEENPAFKQKFEDCIHQIRSFQMDGFKQTNMQKCEHCIYEPLCDSSLLE